MRELTIRIKFKSHCLGNVKTRNVFCIDGKQKKRTIFLHLRSPQNKVQFMQSWWQAGLRTASKVLCRYQKDVADILFSTEIDGQPRKLPEEVFKRWYNATRFSPHEAFFPGDIIGVSCLVPPNIDDDGLWRLMDLAGDYCGVSPFKPGEYGFFQVESIKRRGNPAPTPEGTANSSPLEADGVVAE